jgi:Domain of Unknown Function (DUF928)
MFSPKFSPKKILIASACSCLAVSTVALPFSLSLFTPTAQAQSRRVRYVPPSNLDAPKVSSTGSTRSSCTPGKDCLIALSPDLKPDESPVPQTISERPTIYFLSPKYSGPVKFVISEVLPLKPNAGIASTKKIYDKTFIVNNDAGIIALKIPNDAPIFEIGKTYIWKFTVNPRNIYGGEIVSGYLRRVLPTKKLVTQLQTVSQPVERAALFAQEGIWFEAVEALAEAQLRVPTSIEVTDEWTALLKSANLDRVLLYSFVLQKQAPKQLQEQ